MAPQNAAGVERTPRRPLTRRLPAPPGLRPLQQVIDAAERVGDAVLAAVADEQDAAVAQRTAAMRAAAEAVVGLAGAHDRPRVPVRALDGPGHDVLEAAEGGLALTLGLGRAKTLVRTDLDPAPA